MLTATTRKELNEAFYGLVQVPTPSRALGVHPAYQPLVRPETTQQAGRGAAGFAHFSSIFLWLLGPGLVFAASAPGHVLPARGGEGLQLPADRHGRVRAGRRSSAASPGWTSFGVLMPLIVLGWLVLTIIGGAKALQGDDWRNPVKSVVKLEVLTEK